MIEFELKGDHAVVASFKRQSQNVQDEVTRSIGQLTLRLTTKIKREYLSGQMLNVRTGRLRRSISPLPTTVEGNTVIGTVQAGGGSQPLVYAAIHEYGGVILPVKADALRFKIGNHWIFSKKVTMPERSYMRAALKDMTPEIQTEFFDAVSRGVAK